MKIVWFVETHPLILVLSQSEHFEFFVELPKTTDLGPRSLDLIPIMATSVRGHTFVLSLFSVHVASITESNVANIKE